MLCSISSRLWDSFSDNFFNFCLAWALWFFVGIYESCLNGSVFTISYEKFSIHCGKYSILSI